MANEQRQPDDAAGLDTRAWRALWDLISRRVNERAEKEKTAAVNSGSLKSSALAAQMRTGKSKRKPQNGKDNRNEDAKEFYRH
jgi:hypothetical protein